MPAPCGTPGSDHRPPRGLRRQADHPRPARISGADPQPARPGGPPGRAAGRLPRTGARGHPHLPGLRPCHNHRQVFGGRCRSRAMRFLIDRCAETKLAAWLRDNGHAGLAAQSLGPDPGGRSLPELATASSRIMITIDTDFGELIHRQGMAPSVLIRLPAGPPQQRIALTAAAIDRRRQALENNAIITIRNERLQVSCPPAN